MTAGAGVRLRSVVMALLGCAGVLMAQPAKVTVLPPPDWVRTVEWTAATPRRTNETSDGVQYLLYERQHHPGRGEQFQRTIVLMRNETGVQGSGSLSFGFDPSYQELIFHRLVIHRDGQVLERLDRSKIRLIQPEPQLAGHLLTGEQTAVVFVEDLRVGDVLESAYTTRGANPILGGHFSTRFAVQSGVPVDRQRLLVAWAAAQPLQIRPHLTLASPVRTVTGEGTVYLWDFTNATAVAWEDFTPPGFEPYPYVELSDFDSWARVVEWALPLYAVADNGFPPELRQLIDQWQRGGSSNEERARLALQFVQDDLRYTGLELGPDSYRPAPPFETFAKRFGDCKGKVLLLCTIFRAMNLEAWPALVNSAAREAIARRLPSPFAFNHVIVKLNLSGRTIWLDPTISHQGGALGNRFVPPLGKALVVQPGVIGLEDIPRSAHDGPLQRVVSTFSIADDQTPVPLTVQSIYRGFAADQMRERRARTDARGLAKDYLNFYARYYPGIQDARPLEVSDDRLQNVLTVTEHYRITNLWTLNGASNLWLASFYPDSLMDALTEPSIRLRQRPLWLSFPLHRQQEVIVHLPGKDWTIPDKTVEVNHDAFAFRYRRAFSGSTVRFQYECQTRTSEIPADQVPGYLAKREQMEDLLGDTLQRPHDPPGPSLARVNWLMVVVAGFGLCATFVACGWVWHSTRHPVTLPPLTPEDRRLAGLGGWLILVGIGLCLAPISRVVGLVRDWEGFFSLEAWQNFAMPQGAQYHPLYAPLLIFEVLGNALMLGLNLLVLCLYFGKRRIFPKTFIVVLIVNALFLWGDELLGQMVPFVAEAAGGPTRRQLFHANLWAVIWSAYMLKSRRVRATFREKEHVSAPPPIPSTAAAP